ncbi:hypothetical protein [uncultured Thiodictyon sp.]|uniref:hypothetical protein n=1 Tax=uncultured Thiodictyon sp. TaxID=1846217 RepID=UPI0025E3CF96|nr:hypothetical protein [uncultured Thiodictyon sp.]
MAKFKFIFSFKSPNAFGFKEEEKQEITDVASSLNPLPSELSYSSPDPNKADIGFCVECDSQFAAPQIQNDLRKQIANSSLARYECNSEHPVQFRASIR